MALDGDTGDVHFVPAPCQVACPVGTDAPSYIGLIWEGKLEEAFEAITATNPFSSICGRVCDAPCEPACRRAAADGPLQIRHLKRFVMDRIGDTFRPSPAPVTRQQTVGIVGAGPAGLTAAHDLCQAGYRVHVYEMSDRPGGMMVWGIPAFRLPPEVIQQDIDRLTRRCPGLHLHLNTALGREVTLAELKQRHEAVLLTIGAWHGKPLGIPGDDHHLVVDGVGWLRRVNGGQRPTLPRQVVVVGGGDVAMDACRVARRLPGCQQVTVVYRRSPDEMPARRVELEGALAEGVEFVYHTQPVRVTARDGGLVLTCVHTQPGEPEADGRRRPVNVAGSEHDIPCGMVIASVGQKSACPELDSLGMMRSDRIDTDFDTMRTRDPQVFAAGDGAFGGSTIVMAMHHGQRAAYYIGAYLDGHAEPLPYRTPLRTRRVPVAQDLRWEQLAPHPPQFLGLGIEPVRFPEIETTYDADTARREAARCYRCDAETGSPDYSVRHREDLFTMARLEPARLGEQQAMLRRRLVARPNPFPPQRPPQLEDLVFLPANLSRLVIDPYREACRVHRSLGGRLRLAHPFVVTGFDDAPTQVRTAVARGVAAAQGAYLGVAPLSEAVPVPWLQVVTEGGAAASDRAAALLQVSRGPGTPVPEPRHHDQLTGLVLCTGPEGMDLAALEATVADALRQGADLLLLDGMGPAWATEPWPELRGAPDLSLLRDTVAVLRRLRREGDVDLIAFGGVRSGTDAAKLIGLGAVAVAMGVAAGLAAGGRIGDGGLRFDSDLTDDDRAEAVAGLLRASTSEASMMARCCGKTVLHNIEPEDLRALTLATSQATGIPLAGPA